MLRGTNCAPSHAQKTHVAGRAPTSEASGPHGTTRKWLTSATEAAARLAAIVVLPVPEPPESTVTVLWASSRSRMGSGGAFPGPGMSAGLGLVVGGGLVGAGEARRASMAVLGSSWPRAGAERSPERTVERAFGSVGEIPAALAAVQTASSAAAVSSRPSATSLPSPNAASLSLLLRSPGTADRRGSRLSAARLSAAALSAGFSGQPSMPSGMAGGGAVSTTEGRVMQCCIRRGKARAIGRDGSRV